MRTMKELSEKSGKTEYKYLLELDLTIEAHLEAIEIVSAYQRRHGCGIKAAIIAIINGTFEKNLEYKEKAVIPTIKDKPDSIPALKPEEHSKNIEKKTKKKKKKRMKSKSCSNESVL